MAHRTVRCTPDSPVPPATSSLPLDSDRWSSDMWTRLDVRCTPDMNCSLSGAPVWARLPTARAERALNALAGDRWRGSSRCSVVHRTVRCTPDSPVNFSGAAAARTRGWRVPEVAVRWRTGHVRCTPDSPVNYSAPASANSRGRRVESESPGAPDRYCSLSGGTPDSPVRQTRGALGCPYAPLLNPTLGLFIG
jgi:hypothetical protein